MAFWRRLLASAQQRAHDGRHRDDLTEPERERPLDDVGAHRLDDLVGGVVRAGELAGPLDVFQKFYKKLVEFSLKIS